MVIALLHESDIKRDGKIDQDEWKQLGPNGTLLAKYKKPKGLLKIVANTGLKKQMLVFPLSKLHWNLVLHLILLKTRGKLCLRYLMTRSLVNYKTTIMRDFIGIVKDKVSLSKLALLTNPNTLPLHLAVLRATTHSPSTPPNNHHLATLLSLGDGSRATASTLIHSLIHRLHRTTDATVALKCLFIVHHIIKRGPFILKDQLSIFTSSGGRNNLKLSGFRDGASAKSWVLSGWVRWYACYIETILHTSKTVGFDICSSSSSSFLEREKYQDSISSLVNYDLINDFASLVFVIEEFCKVPDDLLVENDRLIHNVMELLTNDYLSTINEIFLRVIEFKERVNLLTFNESVELASSLDRLRSCKEKSLQLFSNRKPSVDNDMLWEMIEELNSKIGMVHFRKLGGMEKSWSESARFGDRVVRTRDSLTFSSGRLRLN